MIQCAEDEKATEMPVYIDLSPFWQKANPTISEAIRKTGLDRRTLSQAQKGYLDRCQIETLFKLRDFAASLAGRVVTIEEICRKEIE